MILVGLTGGIGSGKTTVRKEWEALGAIGLDADDTARRVVDPGQPAYRKIVEAFGGGVLHPDGTLNREALARATFANPQAVRTLNAITHPAIIEAHMQEIQVAVEEDPRAVIVLEASLLLETGGESRVQAVVVATAPKEVRLERTMARSGLRREEVEARMRAQMSDEDKVAKADYVIDTSGSLEETQVQAKELFAVLKKREKAIFESMQ